MTTARIGEDEVARPKKDECSLASTRETPDLLIGQNMADCFDRQYGPKLPNGFRVVTSGLGPMLGEAGKVASNRNAASNTHAAATLDPEPKSATSTAPPFSVKRLGTSPRLGYNPEDPLNLWTLYDYAPRLVTVPD